MRLRALGSLVKDALRGWSEDKAARMGAALSYYTIFSLAPLLVVVIAAAGLFFGEDATRGRIVGELRGLIGADGARLVETMIRAANEPRAGVVATVIGFATLLLGATGVLMELHEDLNTIWKAPARQGWKGMLRSRLLAFGVVLAFGFLLLVSMVLSAALAALGSRLGAVVPGWVLLGYLLNYGLSLLLVAALTAAVFKLLVEKTIPWRDVWIGATITSVLFHVGKFLIGLYLGKASVGSPFGAAGSLAVLLVWIYYSSQIFLFGAELSKAYTAKLGVEAQAPPEAARERPGHLVEEPT
jgi:membrane protein